MSLQNAELYKAKQIPFLQDFSDPVWDLNRIVNLRIYKWDGIYFCIIEKLFHHGPFSYWSSAKFDMSWLFFSNSAGVNILNALKL